MAHASSPSLRSRTARVAARLRSCRSIENGRNGCNGRSGRGRICGVSRVGPRHDEQCRGSDVVVLTHGLDGRLGPLAQDRELETQVAVVPIVGPVTFEPAAQRRRQVDVRVTGQERPESFGEHRLDGLVAAPGADRFDHDAGLLEGPRVDAVDGHGDRHAGCCRVVADLELLGLQLGAQSSHVHPRRGRYTANPLGLIERRRDARDHRQRQATGRKCGAQVGQVPKATRQRPDIYSPTRRAPERFAHVALEGGKPEVLDVAGRESQEAFAQCETQGPEAATQCCDAIVVIIQVGHGEAGELHEVAIASGYWRASAMRPGSICRGFLIREAEGVDPTRWVHGGG